MLTLNSELLFKRFHVEKNTLSGRYVPNVVPPGARYAFLGASPSSVDALRGQPMSGPARVILERYAKALGATASDLALVNLVPVYLSSASTGAPRSPSKREVDEFFILTKQALGNLPVLALSKQVFEYFPAALAWCPHPCAVAKFPSSEYEAKRKLQKFLTRATSGGTPSVSRADAPSFDVAVFSKSDERRITYGVVLEPGVEDAQGDVETEEEIEKAAHGWMLRSREFEEQHDAPTDSRVIESYLAVSDFEVAGQKIRKGSWVVAAMHSEPMWAKIKSGEITGYSIRGYGQRKPA